MSNSIWKTPDQEQEHNEEVLIEYMGVSGRPFYEFDDFVRRLPNLKRWCYITDLIAQADKAERLQKQLDSLKKYSDSLRHRVEKMLKKNKTLKNTAADYFMKSIELGIELEKTKSNN